MPFKSQAQRGYLFVHHPEIAKRWAHETPTMKKLPQHVATHTKRAVMLKAMKGS